MHEFSLETHLSKDMTRRFSGILIIGVLPSFETFGIPLYSRRQQDRALAVGLPVTIENVVPCDLDSPPVSSMCLWLTCYDRDFVCLVDAFNKRAVQLMAFERTVRLTVTLTSATSCFFERGMCEGY